MNKIKLIGLSFISLASILLVGCPEISTSYTANLVVTPAKVVFESVNSAPKIVVLTNKKGTFQGTVTDLIIDDSNAGSTLELFKIESNTCGTNDKPGSLKAGDSCSFWVSTTSRTTSNSQENLEISYLGDTSGGLEIPVSVNKGPQPIPDPSEYSDLLPNGGQLVSTSGLYLASNSESSILNFSATDITSPVIVNFSISSASSLTGVLPTLSPSSCTLTINNPSCNLNLNLVGSAVGRYLVTPSVGVINLTPVQLTSQIASSVFLPKGRYYLLSGNITSAGDCWFVNEHDVKSKHVESTGFADEPIIMDAPSTPVSCQSDDDGMNCRYDYNIRSTTNSIYYSTMWNTSWTGGPLVSCNINWSIIPLEKNLNNNLKQSTFKTLDISDFKIVHKKIKL